jgi:hypothetical protein
LNLETIHPMKHLLLPFILFTVAFSSCRKPAEPPTLSSVLVSREWRVGLVKDFNVILTQFYNGMKFTFMADGKLKVTDALTVYNGTWSENPNDGTFTIDIISPLFQLDDISQQWKVINASLTGINLVDEEINTTQELRFRNY